MQEPRRREPGETVFGYLILVISLLILHQSYAISGFSSVSSAGVFPMIASSVMAVSATAIILRNRRLAAPDPAIGFIRRVAPPSVLVLTLLIAAYMLTLEPLGFPLSSFLFMFLSMLYFERRRPLLLAGISALSLGIVYVIFRMAFSVVLPQGWLFR
jgi:putative tricarboxylic transport membrane protein